MKVNVFNFHFCSADHKSISNSKQMLCQIDGSDVMTPKGWQPIHVSDESQAFELYEDGNHTFLQWLANDSVRKSLYQKLVLIRLYCSPVDSTAKSAVFMPCNDHSIRPRSHPNL